MIKKTRKVLMIMGAVLLIMGIVSSASATSIAINLNTPYLLSGMDPSQNVINDTINAYFDPIPGPPVPDWVSANWKYTATPEGDPPVVTESGLLAGSYSTAYLPPGDKENALITYDGGNIVAPTAYLLAKDGKNYPAWRFYDLTALGWTGTESISITSLWPDKGSFSHISLYGGEGTPPPPTIPEPGTLILLGLGLTGLAAIKKFKK
jgi:hypothetical protein